MHKPLFVSLILSGIILYQTPAEARIYEYVDDRGKKVFVDRLSKVPPEYREQLKSRKERKEDLDAAAVAKLQQERDLKLLKLKLTRERRRLQEDLTKWTTPINFQGNRIIVPVKVVYGGRSTQLSLVLDTGASSTIIHQSAIKSLGAKLNPGGYARIADGSVVEIKEISFSRVQIGPYNMEHVRAGVIDYKNIPSVSSSSSQGLLGMDFLLDVRYELDRGKNQIIWDPSFYQELQAKLSELNKLEQQLLNDTAAPESK